MTVRLLEPALLELDDAGAWHAAPGWAIPFWSRRFVSVETQQIVAAMKRCREARFPS